MSITYLIPTCGRKRYLEWALRSLEVQTAPWDIIGFDNGSSDGSGPMLADFCSAHSGRFGASPVFIDDGGQASGLALLDMWGGHGVAAFLHDDDMCHPARTERIMEHLGGHDMIFSDMWSFSDGQEPLALAAKPTTGGIWRCDPSRWSEGIGHVVGNTTTPTAAFGARYLDVPQPEGYLSGAQDTLIWLRAARMGLSIGYIPEPLYYYRLHAGQSSATFRTRVPEFDAEVARIHREAEDS